MTQTQDTKAGPWVVLIDGEPSGQAMTAAERAAIEYRGSNYHPDVEVRFVPVALAYHADEILAALETLCTPPDGSDMPLGQHDSGPHFAAMQAAWERAFAAIARATGKDGVR